MLVMLHPNNRNNRKARNNPKKGGFVALLSLLIVATVTMYFAFAMLMDGVNNAALSLNSIYYEDARIDAHSCIEDTLYRMKQEAQFSRNLSYTLAQGDSCSTAMTWFNPVQVKVGVSQRLVNVDVTGVSHSFTRKFRYQLRQTQYTINHADGTYGYMNNIDYIAVDELTS
jgi:hypothetical protein